MKLSTGQIVIIGGNGFIGQGLRAALADAGRPVIIIGRHTADTLRPNERFYAAAGQTYEELGHSLSQFPVDAIIDLAYASVPNTSYADPVSDFSENLGNVIRHLDFACSLSPARFIYVSSGGTVYGDPGRPHAFRETDQNFPLSPYGITKMACERYVQMYHRLHNLDTLIIRPSNIYGPGQKPFRGQGLVATALGLACKGEPVQIFGDGSHIRDYLYIDDFCSGFLELMRQGRSGGIYNLGYGEGHSILDIITCIDEAIAGDGIRLARLYKPERPFDVHYNVLDVAGAAAATNWQPATPPAEGIRLTWQWMREYLRHQNAGLLPVTNETL